MTLADSSHSTSAELVSFVPRLTIDWLRDRPDDLWREVDGTVAFIDISGFTAMSEKLSSQGKAGAEEVTEVMNATFAALLAVAYGQGGGLLKFGGDALLLLYEGDFHAARAARAAFEMRRTLRAIGRPRTSAGAVQLKMHAGLHSGRFEFFLLGDGHRELLIAGPAATETVEMEATSEAGEILVSASTAAAIGEDVLAEEKGTGRLLRAAPDVHGAVEPLPSVDGIPLEIAVPAPLRAQLLEIGPLEGEHRHASIAFVRFSGTDEIIETEGPESAAHALDTLVRAVQAAADEHKVTFLESDIDRDGGRIILVSGAPQTFGDDEERMLRTVRAVVDAGLPLPVHVGVSEGRVFTGQVGASFRRTYTVLGDTAALAARLMARAGEDEVWVSAGVLTRGGASFGSTALEPLALKGKAEPVQAFVLGELLSEEARPEQAATREELPFFDRERERAVLGASVAPVRMGFGTLVELVGEPGIGKSRLAQELRENCTDMRQVDLRCDQYESSTPYYAFRPFLRSLLDVQLNGGGEHNRQVLSERLEKIDPELVPWAPLLAAPLDVEVAPTPQVDDLDPSFWRARLHGVMGTLLGNVLDTPTLLVFDDVHWMDDASSELLRYLGTQLPTKPWLACTTRRPGDDGFAAATGTPPLPALTLRLEPLPEDDARALAVAAAGDRRLTEDEVAALMERAAGNPLFLRELATVGDKVEAAEDLPDTVETLVATRIDQLAPRDRALLRWASVLGERFSGGLIAEVLEGESDVAAGSEAWDRLGEFVERDPNVAGAFRFRHALIRDAAYEGLSFKRRRELHERVADVIERGRGDRADEAAELLSLHYFNAGVWEKAFVYSRRAGDQARAIHAYADAARFYERAAESGQQASDIDGGELGEVWRSLGLALDVTGEFERAMGAFKRAIRLLEDDPDAQAAVYQARAKSLMRLGNYSGALRETTSGLKLVDPTASQAALARSAQLTAMRAEIRLEQGRAREALQLARQAADAAEASRAREALARAYTVIDNAHQQLGEPKKALLERLAVEIYREIGELRAAAIVEMNLGVQAYAEGRWTEAIELYESAERELRRIGDMANAAFVRANMGEILISRNELERARAVLEDAREVLRNFHFAAPAVFADIQLGRLECEAGNAAQAVEALRVAAAEARELHHPYLVVDASVHLSTAYRHNGEPERALQVLDEIGELEGDDVLVLGARFNLAQAAALVDVGNAADAAIALEGALALAREQEQLHEIAEILLARADLARAAGQPTNDEELEEATRLLQLFES